jgi:5-formyltetrahydrofolate cyclo-ligase
MSQHALRRQLLKQRRQLAKQQQRAAAKSLVQQVIRTRWLQKAQHIAFYMAVRCEIDPQPVLRRALAMKKRCYLPVLHPLKPRRLLFVRYQRHTRLIRNRYGILEPVFKPCHVISPRALNLVFVPLVGFDQQGNRLGMGGGYYDTTFAFLRKRIHARRQQPKLVGLAYNFQHVKQLQPNPWDIPLQAVITQRGVCNVKFCGGSTF